MEERQLSGYVIVITGLIMILINAMSYIFNWDLKSPVFTILGLILVVIGARTVKKSSQNQVR
jgi:membrane protein implicated in regulation of membrane protease activity